MHFASCAICKHAHIKELKNMGVPTKGASLWEVRKKPQKRLRTETHQVYGSCQNSKRPREALDSRGAPKGERGRAQTPEGLP